jgi:hypothetical protein
VGALASYPARKTNLEVVPVCRKSGGDSRIAAKMSGSGSGGIAPILPADGFLANGRRSIVKVHVVL